ncbi:hypothetical protein IFM89_002196 [Coptis chinensis]|uniref:Ankyrin repeat protein n=1 Tax=Coptis chinensis TaxID=261450 RepID=A0A835I6Q5_9MAGN|nr:hypothetical protein IFM89_002196 [Coptis chinensis]
MSLDTLNCRWDRIAAGFITIYFFRIVAAVLENSLPSVKLLIEAGANLNVGTCGVVPMVVATTQVESEMIKCLLKEGADPNVSIMKG